MFFELFACICVECSREMCFLLRNLLSMKQINTTKVCLECNEWNEISAKIHRSIFRWCAVYCFKNVMGRSTRSIYLTLCSMFCSVSNKNDSYFFFEEIAFMFLYIGSPFSELLREWKMWDSVIKASSSNAVNTSSYV